MGCTRGDGKIEFGRDRGKGHKNTIVCSIITSQNKL